MVKVKSSDTDFKRKRSSDTEKRKESSDTEKSRIRERSYRRIRNHS